MNRRYRLEGPKSKQFPRRNPRRAAVMHMTNDPSEGHFRKSGAISTQPSVFHIIATGGVFWGEARTRPPLTFYVQYSVRGGTFFYSIIFMTCSVLVYVRLAIYRVYM